MYSLASAGVAAWAASIQDSGGVLCRRGFGVDILQWNDKRCCQVFVLAATWALVKKLQGRMRPLARLQCLDRTVSWCPLGPLGDRRGRESATTRFMRSAAAKELPEDEDGCTPRLLQCSALVGSFWQGNLVDELLLSPEELQHRFLEDSSCSGLGKAAWTKTGQSRQDLARQQEEAGDGWQSRKRADLLRSVLHYC